MYNKGLVVDILVQVIEAVEMIDERCEFAKDQHDFIDTKLGQEKLDAICMKDDLLT